MRLIYAQSPQAKGRVERVNRTLQDRLVQELALAKIQNLAAANTYLEEHFLARLNRWIGVRPAEGADLHRAVPPSVRLEDVLCHRETRRVGADWCVRVANQILPIDRQHVGLSLAGREVEVRRHAEQSLDLRYGGQMLRWPTVPTRPAPTVVPPTGPVSHQPCRPGSEHPWRRGWAGRVGRAGAPAVKPAPLQEDSLRSPSFRSAGLTASPGG